MRILIGVALCSACVTQEKNLGVTEPDPTPAKVIGNPRWVMTFGTWDNEVATSVAIDSNENVLAAGIVKAGTDFGSGQVALASQEGGAFVTKRSAGDGGEVWTRVFDPGLSALVEISSIAADAQDNVYICGSYGGKPSGTGTVDFGGQSLSAIADGFVGKLDSSGNLVWIRGFGANSLVYCRDVVVADGRVFVVGDFRGTIELAEGPVTAPIGQDFWGDGFIEALDASGTPIWSHVVASTTINNSYAGGHAVAIAADGDVVMYGGLVGAATFGGEPFTAPSGANPYVARFTRDGGLRWRTTTGAADSSPYKMVVRPDNAIVSLGIPSGSRARMDAIDGNGDPLWTNTDYLGGVSTMTTTDDGVLVVSGAVSLTDEILPSYLFIGAHAADGTRTESHVFDQPAEWDSPHVGFLDMASKHGTLALAGVANVQFDFGTGLQRWDGRTDILIMLMDAPAQAE